MHKLDILAIALNWTWVMNDVLFGQELAIRAPLFYSQHVHHSVPRATPLLAKTRSIPAHSDLSTRRDSTELPSVLFAVFQVGQHRKVHCERFVFVKVGMRVGSICVEG